jgi:hypothetical protein
MRIFMQRVDNLDQAPLRPGPENLIQHLYSPKRITMRPVATSVPSSFREFFSPEVLDFGEQLFSAIG